MLVIETNQRNLCSITNKKQITIASTEVGLARFYEWTINFPNSVMRVVKDASMRSLTRD